MMSSRTQKDTKQQSIWSKSTENKLGKLQKQKIQFKRFQDSF